MEERLKRRPSPKGRGTLPLSSPSPVLSSVLCFRESLPSSLSVFAHMFFLLVIALMIRVPLLNALDIHPGDQYCQ